MEHFKKRLIHQHEKPDLRNCDSSIRREHNLNYDEERRNSSLKEQQMREDKIQSKVAKKRAVCRGKFRHNNLELFKLGASIPTSLCKTKDPYNVSTEKNLQLSCQNVQNNAGKQDEHLPKKVITDYIISSIEGKGRKDIMQRSISASSELLPHRNANTNESDLNIRTTGRHILPAIVPEVPPEPRRNGRRGSTTYTNDSRVECEQTKYIQEQTQTQRQPINKRRQTVIGTEMMSETRTGETVSSEYHDSHRNYRRIHSGNEEIILPNNSVVNVSIPPPSKPQTPTYSTAQVDKNMFIPRQTVPSSENTTMFYSTPQNTLPPFRSEFTPSNYSVSNCNERIPPSTNISTPTRCSNMSEPHNRRMQQSHQFGNVPKPTTNVHISASLPMISELVANPSNGPQHGPNSSHNGSAHVQVPFSKLPPLRVEGGNRHVDPINLSVKRRKYSVTRKNNHKMNQYLTRNNSVNLPTEPSTSHQGVARNDTQNPIWFPRINEQNNRTLPNFHREQIRSKNQERINQEAAIKSTIDGANAAMELPFSLDSLFSMNKCYRELQSFLIKRTVSKELKESITKTINKLVTYVSYMIFGKRNCANFRIYGEKIMEVELIPQKLIMQDFLNSGISKSDDEDLIKAFIKVIRGDSNCPTMSNREITRIMSGWNGNYPLPWPPTSHQVSNTFSLPNFQPQFIPSAYHKHGNSERQQQQNGAMQSNPYSTKHHESRHILPKTSSSTRQDQNMLHHLLRPPNITGSGNIHYQKPDTAQHADNRCVPPNINQHVNQSYRQEFPNMPEKTSQISHSYNKSTDIRNEENHLSIVPSKRMKKRNINGQDVEELLQLSIIIGKEIIGAESSDLTEGEKLNQNVHEISSPLNKKGVENKDSITKTVIVKDNSMEITKGETSLKASNKAVNETVLEKIESSITIEEETKVNIKKEPLEDSTKKNPLEELQIFKKYLLEENKDVYKNVMKKVVQDKETKMKPPVIMIVDDEDIHVQKVDENAVSSNESKEKSKKTLKTDNKQKNSSEEILIVDDEEKSSIPSKKTTGNKDVNQNYVSNGTGKNESNKQVSEQGTDRNSKTLMKHLPIIEDISSDDDTIHLVEDYTTNDIRIKTTILESKTKTSHNPPINDTRSKTNGYSQHTESKTKNAQVKTTGFTFKDYVDSSLLPVNINRGTTRQDRVPPSPSNCFSSPPNNNFTSHFPQGNLIYSQRSKSYDLSPKARASSPLVAKSPVRSPVSSNSVSSVARGKPELNWQSWISDECREFFDFDRKQSTSRRHSVETISSVGSDYSPKVVAEQNLVEIKVDSKWYRINKSLYEKIPKGKLCYIRETNTFIRYFDDNQMAQFLGNLNLENTIASDFLKQIKGHAESIPNCDTYLGCVEQNEVIKVSKDADFSREDYIPEPELYVQEVQKVEHFAPKDFHGFYRFVTGYQIVHNNHPISFQTFLIMHNTNRIKLLFKQYLSKLLGK